MAERMAERERRQAPPYGGVFVARTRVMDSADVQRAVWRMAHEIIEHNQGIDEVVLIGLQTGGIRWPTRWRAPSTASSLEVPVGTLDVALYRDDIGLRPVLPEAVTDIPWTSTAAWSCCATTCSSPAARSGPRSNALVRLRPAPRGAAGGDDRPRPPRAADPPGLRRQEPADPARRGRRRPPRRRRPRGDAPMTDRCATCSTSTDLGGAAASTSCCGSPTPSSRSPSGAIPKVPALRGHTVAWLFYEDSTRTRLSFETAAKRLSADTMNFCVELVVGEEGRVAARHRPDHRGDGRRRHRRAPRLGRRARTASPPGSTPRSINAGDGWHEHPTQALLDCYTIRQHLGSLDGQHIAIVGDIKHSRVARSDVLAFTAMGAEVTLVAPPTLLPPSLEGWPVKVSHDLDAVLPDGRRRLPPAHAARAHDRGAAPVAARVHRHASASPTGGSSC